MGKKRKADVDMDLERGLYTTFVAAANSISQLYTQASAQQRQSRDAGARAALERVFNWAMREHGTQTTIPTASLLEYLRQEIQNTDSQVEMPPQAIPFPACVPPPNYTSGLQPSPAKRQETGFPPHNLEGQQGAFGVGGMTADMDECSQSM